MHHQTEYPGNPVSEGPGNPVSEGPGNPVSEGPGNPVSEGPGNPVSEGPGNPVGAGHPKPSLPGPGNPVSEGAAPANPSDVSERYSITVIDGRDGILDILTQEVCFPDCIQDLRLLYSYAVQADGKAAGQLILARAMRGEKPVTEMHAIASGQHPAGRVAKHPTSNIAILKA